MHYTCDQGCLFGNAGFGFDRGVCIILQMPDWRELYWAQRVDDVILRRHMGFRLLARAVYTKNTFKNITSPNFHFITSQLYTAEWMI